MRNRFEAAGAIHHVVPKGNAGQCIVEDHRDCAAFVARFGEVVRGCGWIAHASCLMSTHHHAVIETPIANLSEGIKRIQGGHARWFNLRHERKGNLFAQHCWSRRLFNDDWFLRACLYAVLNPVVAGLCSHPSQWRWSSFATTAYGDPTCYARGEERLLGLLGETPREARRRYVEIIDQSVEIISARRLESGGSLWQALGEPRVVRTTSVSD